MRCWICMPVFSAIARSANPMNTLKRQRSLVSIWGRPCCRSGGTARGGCCLNCCQPAPKWPYRCSVNNYIIWALRFDAVARTMALSASSTTTPDITLKLWPGRSWLSLDWLQISREIIEGNIRKITQLSTENGERHHSRRIRGRDEHNNSSMKQKMNHQSGSNLSEPDFHTILLM